MLWGYPWSFWLKLFQKIGGTLIQENLAKINIKISLACKKSNRTSDKVCIIAASKRQEISIIQKAIGFEINNFGENYAQELEQKQNELNNQKLIWHFIGPLQKNKVKKVVGKVEYIHSVHKVKLVEEISKRAQELKVVQKILLQVNIAAELTKSGFLPNELEKQIEAIQKIDNIQICGLMCMPPLDESVDKKGNFFKKTYELSKKLESMLSKPHHMNELSMGTSNDFVVAIEYGATMVRLGTVLLGQRS
jgi:pyridoxal phosphate enzyme (YggS family)